MATQPRWQSNEKSRNESKKRQAELAAQYRSSRNRAREAREAVLATPANGSFTHSQQETSAVEASAPAPAESFTNFAGKVAYRPKAQPDSTASSFQPWTSKLVDLVLRAAVGRKGDVHVALVWPGRLESVVSLHALSTLELTLDTQLEGLRTLFFPARFDVRRDLAGWLVDRPQLARLSRSIYKMCPQRHVFVPEAKTFSEAKFSLLKAINDIENHAATKQPVPHPTIGEIVPTFLWQAAGTDWTSYKDRLLERSLKKVRPLSLKQQFRASIEGGLSVARTATDALLAVHHDTKRADWRNIFVDLGVSKRPDVLLLDATSAATRTNFQAVRRIPEFLSLAREKGFPDRDAVIVTDEPLTYFDLLARLRDLHISPKSRLVVPVEPTMPILSPTAFPSDWRPSVRSNARVTLSIVDRDASGVASTFYRIAHEINRDSPAAQALVEAGNYLIRLSNTPAGLSDLLTYCSDVELTEYAKERLRWSHYDAQIRAGLQSGAYSPSAYDVEAAVTKAEKHLDLWREHTPMALCLRDEVKLLAQKKLRSLRVIVPSNRYGTLGEMFLSRTMGQDYEAVRGQLTWTAQREAGEMPRASDRDHILFLGLTPKLPGTWRLTLAPLTARPCLRAIAVRRRHCPCSRR